MAWQEADGTIVLVVSTQAPFRDRWEIGHALGLPLDRICGSSALTWAAASAARTAPRSSAFSPWPPSTPEAGPSRCGGTGRRASLAGYKRHAARMHYRLGAAADGTLQALHCRLYYDTGAYAHLGGEVMALGMEHAGGPYRIPHTLIEGWCVYTNNPIAGAMRGFGVAQVSFAFERMMDLLAARLRHGPPGAAAARTRCGSGDRNGSGVTMTQSTGILPCLEKVAGHPLWRGPRGVEIAQPGPFKKRGVGVAAVFNAMGYGRGLPDSAIAKVELTPEGRIRVYCGVSDMGQGNATAFFQIAGQILCQENDLPSSSSSRTRTGPSLRDRPRRAGQPTPTATP